jgi:D-alanyl-D-alanine carboxypeptidase
VPSSIRRRLPRLVAATIAAALLAGCAAGASTLGTTTTVATTPVTARPSTSPPATLPTTPATLAPTSAASAATTTVPGATTSDVDAAAEVVPAAPPGSFPPYAPTTAVARASTDAPTDPFAALDKSIQSALFTKGALTVEVAIAKDGVLVHQQAFGNANPYTGSHATVTSRFRVGSISKMLLGIALLQLVQEGKLSLDAPGALDPLAKQLGVAYGDPAMPTITLRELLSHTSGFDVYDKTFFGDGAKDCPAAAKKGLTSKLIGPPDTIYRYSNMNFCVLGLLAQLDTGESYQQLVDGRVLEPLGITDMRTVDTYEFKAGDVVHPTTPNRLFMEALGAAGTWVATAADLVKILDAVDPTKPGIHFLTPETLAMALTAPPVPFPHPDRWYGLAMRVWDNGAGWGHTGTLENARSMVFHRPDGITWAIMVNGNTPSNTDNLEGIMDKALASVTSWPAIATPAG